MKKTYFKPEVEVVLTMPVRNYLIGASANGASIIEDGGNTQDAGITEGDVKGSIFEETPW